MKAQDVNIRSGTLALNLNPGDSGGSDTAIRSRYARLTVLVPPEPPRILQGKYHSTTEDSEVKLECVAVGGKPPAEITWVDSNAGVLTQGVNYTVEALSDGQRYTARSVITMTPKQEHHNQTFTCQAQNTADRAYRSASILIEELLDRSGQRTLDTTAKSV
ncbi:hypothetical protein JYU34_022190 [Plutella xylostella]|uniref:Ig-like domain-containing protein n=1 Tax=Plutella xylostella TaxID=51655 RepID=A0ABQ7PS12_PLUXY|nr:hypothetical protein JYU34_022190 [Plutella xylostella]